MFQYFHLCHLISFHLLPVFSYISSFPSPLFIHSFDFCYPFSISFIFITSFTFMYFLISPPLLDLFLFPLPFHLHSITLFPSLPLLHFLSCTFLFLSSSLFLFFHYFYLCSITSVTSFPFICLCSVLSPPFFLLASALYFLI